MPIPPERWEFSGDDQETEREVQQRLGAMAGRCPSPDLLRADAEGVLPDDTSAKIQVHLRHCPVCAQLHRDLQQVEPAGPTAEQLERMRAAIPQPPGRARSIGLFRWMLPAFAIVTAAIIFIWVAVMPRQGRAPRPSMAQKSATAPRGIAVEIAKAPIEIPAAMLPMRGATGSAQPSLDEWTSALEPYRNNDFAQAAERIGAIARKYPNFGDAYFYLGVSQLLLHKNKEAATTLAKAESIETGDHKIAAEWYLGAADAEAGDVEQARAAWKQVCGSSSDYSRQACAALQRLGSQKMD